MSLPETMKAIVNMAQGDNLVCGVHEVPTPTLSDPNDLIIKMEASPLNPADFARVAQVGHLAKMQQKAVQAGSAPGSVMVEMPEQAKSRFSAEAQVLGNEGCGTVVAAGDSAAAQALIGKRVALYSGKSFSQYVKSTLGSNPMFTVLPADIGPLEGASVCVNPMTAVAFVHTMQEEGHKALVHTAAASQLGQMLVKYCKGLGVPLVNIVRKPEQVAILRELGAEHVVNTSAETYKADLLAAVKATGATLGFDATGGGRLAGDILAAIDQALRETEGVEVHPAYGPTPFRQVYRYGGLDQSDTALPMGLSVGNWAYGGWLMSLCFKKYGGADAIKKAMGIVANDLKDTFSTTYGKRFALDEFAANPEQYLENLKAETGAKVLLLPNGVI